MERLVTVLILALMLLLIAANSAAAVECRAEKGTGHDWWSWRLIDNKKCWYAGHGRIDKSRLRWGDDAPVKRDIKELPVQRTTAPAQPVAVLAQPVATGEPPPDLAAALRLRAGQLRAVTVREPVPEVIELESDPDPTVPVPVPLPVPRPPTAPQSHMELISGLTLAASMALMLLLLGSTALKTRNSGELRRQTQNVGRARA